MKPTLRYVGIPLWIETFTELDTFNIMRARLEYDTPNVPTTLHMAIFSFSLWSPFRFQTTTGRRQFFMRRVGTT